MAAPRRLQDIPPRWAHFCLDVERTCRDEFGVALGASSLVCACSGGADSTALLLLCALLVRRGGGRLVCAHLDHSLRQESPDDRAFVESLCAELDIPCRSSRAAVREVAENLGCGLEEAGREARYAFLEEVRGAAGADWIVTAHHQDDLAEDIVLRLMRGAGWPALSGMTGRDDARRLLRPLLLTSGASLREFLRGVDQPWREDATNADRDYTRNRVRLDILPLLQRENPSFRDAASRLWRLGRVDADYWETQLDALPAPLAVEGGLLLRREVLAALAPALRLRLYRRVLDGLGEGQALAETLFALDQAFEHGKNGTTYQFPGGKSACLQGAGILFLPCVQGVMD